MIAQLNEKINIIRNNIGIETECIDKLILFPMQKKPADPMLRTPVL